MARTTLFRNVEIETLGDSAEEQSGTIRVRLEHSLCLSLTRTHQDECLSTQNISDLFDAANNREAVSCNRQICRCSREPLSHSIGCHTACFEK